MADDDATQADPPRLRWLKRLMLAAAVLALLLGGLRWYWGKAMQQRLDETVADIQAEGEPVLFDELATAPLPDDENGAWFLSQALANWPTVPGTQGQRLLETDWYTHGEAQGITDPITDNPAYLSSCKAALDLLRQADKRDDADWGVVLSRPVMLAMMPHLSDTRELARLMRDAAERALAVGDTALALEIMVLMQTHAEHVQARAMSLIDFLVANSIMALNRELIEQSLPKIDPHELKEGAARVLAFELIDRLIGNKLHEGLVRGMVGERASLFDVYECLIDGTMPAHQMIGNDGLYEFIVDTPGLRQAYMPALKAGQQSRLSEHTELIEAVKQGRSYQHIANVCRQINLEFESTPPVFPPLDGLAPANELTVRTYFRNAAALNLAAAAIAIKLYQADHDGERPDTLAQLVPAYLRNVPTDIFSETGEPIRYKPQGVTPYLNDGGILDAQQRAQLALKPYALLYSAGENQVDEGGQSFSIDEYGVIDEQSRFSTEHGPDDLWLLLDAGPTRVFSEVDLYGDETYDDEY